MSRIRYLLALTLFCGMLSGCMSTKSFVDTALPQASKANVAVVYTPKPIQVMYEYQSEGSTDARGTENSRDLVFQVARDSGLFSVVTAEPQPNQRRLSIVINNFDANGASIGRGIGVGLTLGLAGTLATDSYSCRATLTVPGGAPVVFEYKHAIHTAIGNASAPPGMSPEPTAEAAVEKIFNQLLWSIMRDVSKVKALQ